jgi:hypothetical protein
LVVSGRKVELQELSQVLDGVVEELSRGAMQPENLQGVLDVLLDFRMRLQDTLEYLLKGPSDKKEKWQPFYEYLMGENAGELCEKLRRYGFSLRGTAVHERVYDKEKRQPRGLAYRILELIRLGKRDEVFFSFLNVFQGTEIKPILARAFNPMYSDQLFKTFLYSFLSGLLGPEKSSPEEVE